MPSANVTVAEARTLAAYPLAQCLDGSPARYYLSKGDPSRFFIFFEGGGFCKNLADCQERATSYLGSTTHDQHNMVLDRPYFTRSPALSPLLSSFTFAFVRYCDGGYFSSDRWSPVKHNGTVLHFRGRYILNALFDHLNLSRATDVVIGGCSAGGIHVLAHLDAMRAMLPPTAEVSGFADSGFYLDINSFTSLKRFVVSPEGQNATSLLNPACTAAFPTSKEKCLIAQRSAPFLRTPTFVWQSRYDLDQRACELSRDCAASPTCVDAYAKRLSRAIHDELLEDRRTQHGAFIDTCDRHCDDGVKRPHKVNVDGTTPLQAFALWRASARNTPRRLHSSNHSGDKLWEMAGGKATC
jgi:hypothetical protein